MSTLQPHLQLNLQNQNYHPLLISKPLTTINIHPSLISSSSKSRKRTSIQACSSSNSQPGGVCPMSNRFASSTTNQPVTLPSSNPDEEDENSPVQLPPGPWKLPVIGNILQLVGDLPHRRLRDLATTYGPVMSVQLGEVYAVIISSVEAAKEVLRTQDVNFANRPPVLASEIVFYNRQDIVFDSYGDHWRQMRRICTMELLSIKRVQSFKSIREEEVSNFIKHLNSKAGQPVNLTEKLFTLTNSVLLRSSIGKKCKDQETLLKVIHGVEEAAGGFKVADVFPSAIYLHDITGDMSVLKSLRRDADLVLDGIINEHRAIRSASGNDHDDDQGKSENLLDVLLDLQESGNLELPLTDDRIKATILDIFGAGSDSSSITTEWALSELVKHPETMKKAQDEVRKVFSEKGYVEEARFDQLKYLKLVIKETLRLHPPLPLIPRESREKTKVNEYDILPKTKTLVNIWAISRDPTVWPEAEKFIPERFENTSIDFKGNHLEFAPFGSGKRICPGMALGQITIELFLAQLLYHFDWKVTDGKNPQDLDMDEVLGTTVKRKIDLNLVPVPFRPHAATK